MEAAPLTIERSYNASIEKVWNAITDPQQMRNWYFDIPDFKAEIGFEFTFVGHNEGKEFVHLCQITEVITQRILTYSWQYQGFGGKSFVTFELVAENEHTTRLKLTHEGLETFPHDNPAFAKSNFEAGWNELIGNSLKRFVEPTHATN